MIEPRKDLLQIEDLSREEIEHVLAAAQPFTDLFKRSVKKVPTLQGKTVLSLFYEPSTRTSSSFEVAAQRLSADVTSLDVASSSVVKGESVLDTVDTLQAMRADYIIIRHKQAGIPNLIANHTRASVINAGDGFHAHPTRPCSTRPRSTMSGTAPTSPARKCSSSATSSTPASPAARVGS